LGGAAVLGQLAVAFGVHGVGRFAFGRDLAAVLGQLVGGQVPLLGRGAGQDFVSRGAGRGALVAQLVEQFGHRRRTSDGGGHGRGWPRAQGIS
jgi:hypothetical protein